jgi:two-component system cell cycle response regulator DivK
LHANSRNQQGIGGVRVNSDNRTATPIWVATMLQIPGRKVGTELMLAKDPAQAKTVLIVEDNELNMKLFNDLLEAHGYRVLQTRDGLTALDIARQHMPDLIIMDIQLPEVSGIEVTKWLKEDDELRRIPVIAVTAFAMKGDEEKIREGGCEAYISKPISVMSFLKTVDGFLKRPQ